jgi:hypothetical protein
MRKRDKYFEVAAAHSAGLNWITILDSNHHRHENYRARYDIHLHSVLSRRPDTMRKLWTFLHECGHSKLHRDLKRSIDVPYHSVELEAERYALEAIRAARIDISPKVLCSTHTYIFGELLGDVRAGFDPTEGVFEYLEETAFHDPECTVEAGKKYVERVRSLPRTTAYLAAWYHNVQHPILTRIEGAR